MATNWNQYLSDFSAQVEGAEKAKGASAESTEGKVGRAARQLRSSLSEVVDLSGLANVDVPTVNAFTETLSALSALSAQGFDRSTGQTFADKVGALLSVDSEDRAAAFNKVAEDAQALLTRWNETAPARKPRGTGDSVTPESALLSSVGLKSVTINFDHNLEGEKKDHSITHGSTWSSLSNEINKVARALNGEGIKGKSSFSYQKVDPSARDNWRAAVEQLKQGNLGPHAFTITTPKGVISVTITGNAQ